MLRALFLKACRLYEGADTIYAHTLENLSKLFPPESPDHKKYLADLQLKLSGVYLCTKLSRKATELIEQTLPIQRTSVPPDHPSIFRTELKLAKIYRRSAQYERAINILESVLSRLRNILPKTDPDLLVPTFELARCYFCIGKLGKTIELLEHLAKLASEWGDASPDELLQHLALEAKRCIPLLKQQLDNSNGTRQQTRDIETDLAVDVDV